MSIIAQRMEEKVPSEREFEVLSCGNLLYVRKGFVDAQTTIISLTDDLTRQEYHSNNNVHLYGDSWYCFELKDSILAGRTFSGVFIVGGKEHTFRGKAVNCPPSSDGTGEKKSSSRLMTLIPTVVIAVLVIVFAIMAWRNEPSDQTNSRKEPIKKEESKKVNETASSNVGKKTDEQLVNQVPDPKTEESPNTTSNTIENTQQEEKNALAGFFDASKEKTTENKGSDLKTQDGPSENSGDTGEREKEQQFVWGGETQPFVTLPKTAGNNGNEQQPPADAQGNGEETKKEETTPKTVQTTEQQKTVPDAQKKLQHSEPEKVFVPQKTQEPPSNVDVQTVKGPTKPKYATLPTSQSRLKDNATYSITNNTDITNLKNIANSGYKNITLVFCPDRYGTKSKDDYTDKWENFTSKVNDMIDGTIKEVKVIRPYRPDFDTPNGEALKEGIKFTVEELK